MVQIGNRPLEPVAVPHESLPAPVVDLESADAVEQVRQACTTHGFLYGELHSVPARSSLNQVSRCAGHPRDRESQTLGLKDSCESATPDVLRCSVQSRN